MGYETAAPDERRGQTCKRRRLPRAAQRSLDGWRQPQPSGAVVHPRSGLPTDAVWQDPRELYLAIRFDQARPFGGLVRGRPAELRIRADHPVGGRPATANAFDACTLGLLSVV